MFAATPEEVDKLFFEAMNRADLQACVDLHERDARWYMGSEQIFTGKVEIREQLRLFLTAKPTFSYKIQSLPNAGGDVAMVICDWKMAGNNDDGTPITMSARSIEVVRRQSDGRWLYSIVVGGND